MARERNPLFIQAENWLNEEQGRTIKEFRENNPGTPPLKVKTGSLKNQNAKVSFKKEGTFGAEKNRQLWIKETTPDASTRRLANLFIKQNRGKGIQIDHILSNSRLAKGAQHLADKLKISLADANQRARERYTSSGQGYGHDKANLQKLSAEQNNFKNVQEDTLDKLYRLNETEPPKGNKKLHAAWSAKKALLTKKLKHLETRAAELFNDNGNGKVNGKANNLKLSGNKTRKVDAALNIGANLATGNIAGAAVGAGTIAAAETLKSKAAQKAIAQQITKIAAKRGGKSALKLVPGLDVLISGKETLDYLKQGKLDQAGIAALSGAIGWIPIVGDGASAALDLTNTGIDISRLQIPTKGSKKTSTRRLKIKT
tara:strand:+ start:87 stop:1199 length:1113 start_codon:yes stop_codon:yes gene_type:complete